MGTLIEDRVSFAGVRRRAKKRDEAAVLHLIAERIVERFHPEKIILFGSRARGEATPGSDFDLLIVMPVKGSRRDKRVEIGTALSSFGVPVDIMLSTPDELRERSRIPGTIERPAVREGKVIYAKT